MCFESPSRSWLDCRWQIKAGDCVGWKPIHLRRRVHWCDIYLTAGGWKAGPLCSVLKPFLMLFIQEFFLMSSVINPNKGKNIRFLRTFQPRGTDGAIVHGKCREAEGWLLSARCCRNRRSSWLTWPWIWAGRWRATEGEPAFEGGARYPEGSSFPPWKLLNLILQKASAVGWSASHGKLLWSH